MMKTEKMRHDTLDALDVVMKEFFANVGEVPRLVKADVDAAFRRVPVRDGDKWACGIVFRVGDEVSSACLLSFPSLRFV